MLPRCLSIVEVVELLLLLARRLEGEEGRRVAKSFGRSRVHGHDSSSHLKTDMEHLRHGEVVCRILERAELCDYCGASKCTEKEQRTWAIHAVHTRTDWNERVPRYRR